MGSNRADVVEIELSTNPDDALCGKNRKMLGVVANPAHFQAASPLATREKPTGGLDQARPAQATDR
jgi:hypothetical protein